MELEEGLNILTGKPEPEIILIDAVNVCWVGEYPELSDLGREGKGNCFIA